MYTNNLDRKWKGQSWRLPGSSYEEKHPGSSPIGVGLVKSPDTSKLAPKG